MKKRFSIITFVFMMAFFIPAMAFAGQEATGGETTPAPSATPVAASVASDSDSDSDSDSVVTPVATSVVSDASATDSADPVANPVATAIDGFLSTASKDNHTLVLPEGVTWAEDTTVYWKAGEQSAFASTLDSALKEAYKANKNEGEITIVCKPNADVGTMTHGHVVDNITIYGNKAYISGGECDLEVDMYKFNRETGAQDSEGGQFLNHDIYITAYELENLGVWGNRNTSYAVNISLIDCDSKAIEKNVQRVYITGNKGTNNITLKDCDFKTPACPVYSNADGTILIDGCTFTNVAEPINLKHKGTRQASYTIKNCTFTNCGSVADNDKTYAAPIRIVNEINNSTVNATIENCTFTGTVGSNGDILIGDGRYNETCDYEVNLTVKNAGSATKVMLQKSNYYGSDKNVAKSANAFTKDIAAGESLTTSWNIAIAAASTPTAYKTVKNDSTSTWTIELKNLSTEKIEEKVNVNEAENIKQGEAVANVNLDVSDKTAAATVAKSVSADLTKPEITKEITVSNDDKKTAVQKLVAAGQIKLDEDGNIVPTSGSGDVKITIIEEPYLEVEVTELTVDKSTGTSELKLDITPKYNLKATVTTDTQGTQSTSDAVTVSTGNALNVEEKTDVKLQLPEGFAEAGDKLLVTHTKHDDSVEYLTGKVTKEGGVLYVSFTTTGFSPIFLSTAYAASIGEGDNEEVYQSLQAAVDAAKDGDVIKLVKDGETAVVNRAVSFSVNPANESYKYTINLGDKYANNNTDNENTWEIVDAASAKADTAKSDTAKAGTAKTANSPLTGDNSELGIFAVAGLISAVGVALVLRRKHSM